MDSTTVEVAQSRRLARGDGVVIVLVRHGQTRWNRERRFLGVTDLELDETGHAQARDLVERLGESPFDAVYASPLARARQTAAYLHPDPFLVAGLRELDQGELEGLLRDEAMARFPEFFQQWAQDPSDVPPPAGESLRTCQARAIQALLDIGARHRPGEVVAAVTHQLVIASTTCAIHGAALGAWREHGVPNVATRPLLFRDGALHPV